MEIGVLGDHAVQHAELDHNSEAVATQHQQMEEINVSDQTLNSATLASNAQVHQSMEIGDNGQLAVNLAHLEHKFVSAIVLHQATVDNNVVVPVHKYAMQMLFAHANSQNNLFLYLISHQDVHINLKRYQNVMPIWFMELFVKLMHHFQMDVQTGTLTIVLNTICLKLYAHKKLMEIGVDGQLVIVLVVLEHKPELAPTQHHSMVPIVLVQIHKPATLTCNAHKLVDGVRGQRAV